MTTFSGWMSPISTTLSAADVVIAEADNVVEIGDIQPENVVTSGAFVNYIVDGGNA